MAEKDTENNKPSFVKRLLSPSPTAGGSKPPAKKANLEVEGGATALKTEDDDEVLSGNLSIEVVESVAANHDTNNYAGAADKPKVDMKNLVYVQRGRERRLPIPKGLFMAFMTRLHYNMWNLENEEFKKINIDWSDHHLGRGLIACMDVDSTAYVKRQADTFVKEGETVRAWLKHEFGKQTTYQGFLHSEIWGNYRGPAAVAWILKKNNLSEFGKFIIFDLHGQYVHQMKAENILNSNLTSKNTICFKKYFKKFFSKFSPRNVGGTTSQGVGFFFHH